MAPDDPRRPLTSDQKRMLLVLLVIVAVIAILSIAIGGLALSLGFSPLIAVILAVVVAAVVALFMFLNMM